MSYLVYKIPNRVNDKLYIGSTANGIPYRWKEHQTAVFDSRQTHRPLYVAMKKYGIDQFWIEQVEECLDESTMHAREMEWIKDLGSICPNGYNAKIHTIGDKEAAIIRFNVYGWKAKQYAEAFGLSVESISYVKSRYSPFQHITRDHIPDNPDEIMARAARVRDIRKIGEIA